MKNIIPLTLLCFATLFMTACSQIELGSHMYKKFSRPEPQTSTVSKGNFKVGKPYDIKGTTYYPEETYDYVETGIASWYGPGFHANKTASGERYDQNELTAAHRTLQMPSLVRVTNLSNGRSVVVRVNDRGPFAKGRIIDVSAKAAELLGMVKTGTARVKIELLENESRAIANAAKQGRSTKGVEVAFNRTGQLPTGYYVPPTGPVASDIPSTEADIVQVAQVENVKGHYTSGNFYPDPVVEQVAVTQSQIFVQAGTFGDINNARRLAQKLGSIANTNIEPTDYSGRILYRVRLGPIENVRAADGILSKVLSSGHSDARIIVQ
jgi:rare lipoprotein A